jgi:cell division protein ZapA
VKSIRVTILGKQYPLRVEDHDEAFMHEIARFVDERLQVFRSELPGQPESTFMVLACLSLAEELFADRRNRGARRDGDTALILEANLRLAKLLADIESDFSHISDSQ